MSVTYVDPQTPRPIAPEANTRELEGFTPVFARGAVRRKTVRSWMILAPVGVLTVAAFGAWMAMSPADPAASPQEAAPQAAPETVMAQGALEPYPVPLDVEGGAAPEPVVAAAIPEQAIAPDPSVRTARPAPRPAAPAAEAPVEIPTGPQSYEDAVAADPAPATPVPTEPAPFVVVQPG